jgi:hypothetical protein
VETAPKQGLKIGVGKCRDTERSLKTNGRLFIKPETGRAAHNLNYSVQITVCLAYAEKHDKREVGFMEHRNFAKKRICNKPRKKAAAIEKEFIIKETFTGTRDLSDIVFSLIFAEYAGRENE